MASRTTSISAGKVPELSLRSVLAVIACAVPLGGCGDEADPVARSTVPVATATATATAEPTPTARPAETPTATATATATADATPEAGDERGNRVPLVITLAAEDVLPSRLMVPAFLGLHLVVRNESGRERVLRLDDKVILESLPGDRQSINVEGLRPGDHVLDAGESGRAVIVAQRAG